jgi:hypothetical protein
MLAMGLASDFVSAASTTLTSASTDRARSGIGLATTTPNKATKKRTESDANLVNCMMMMIEKGEVDGCGRDVVKVVNWLEKQEPVHACLYTHAGSP